MNCKKLPSLRRMKAVGKSPVLLGGNRRFRQVGGGRKKSNGKGSDSPDRPKKKSERTYPFIGGDEKKNRSSGKKMPDPSTEGKSYQDGTNASNAVGSIKNT